MSKFLPFAMRVAALALIASVVWLSCGDEVSAPQVDDDTLAGSDENIQQSKQAFANDPSVANTEYLGKEPGAESQVVYGYDTSSGKHFMDIPLIIEKGSSSQTLSYDVEVNSCLGTTPLEGSNYINVGLDGGCFSYAFFKTSSTITCPSVDIDSAEILFTVSGWWSGSSESVWIGRITSSWTPSTLTYNNRPGRESTGNSTSISGTGQKTANATYAVSRICDQGYTDYGVVMEWYSGGEFQMYAIESGTYSMLRIFWTDPTSTSSTARSTTTIGNSSSTSSTARSTTTIGNSSSSSSSTTYRSTTTIGNSSSSSSSTTYRSTTTLQSTTTYEPQSTTTYQSTTTSEPQSTTTYLSTTTVSDDDTTPTDDDITPADDDVTPPDDDIDDDSDDDNDDDNCIQCTSTAECTTAMGTGWVCIDDCCVDQGSDDDNNDDDNQPPSSDDDDDSGGSSCGC